VGRLLSLGRVGRGDRVGRVLARSLGALTEQLVSLCFELIVVKYGIESYLLGRAVLKNTLVAGVSSLEGELDALVVAEAGGDLGSGGGLRHFEEGLCVSEEFGREEEIGRQDGWNEKSRVYKEGGRGALIYLSRLRIRILSSRTRCACSRSTKLNKVSHFLCRT
jgi:hypothetical protein